jgi:uncharacterized protein
MKGKSMRDNLSAEKIEYYFKVTKQCNLRCLYCSEQENYKNLQTLTPAIIKRIFSKIIFFHKQNKLKNSVRLLYTGGEVLVLGKKWMREIMKLQKEIFGAAAIEYSTFIQTNLTLLDQEWIEIFKKERIPIGTSLDLFAETRPFKGRKSNSAHKVIDNLIMLAENKLSAGVIIVITKQNYKKGKEIFKVLNEAGLSFHTLPLEPDSIKYCPDLEISAEEYARCLIDIAGEYLKPNNRISVSNLDGYVSLIKHGYLVRGGMCIISRHCWEGNLRLFFENTGDAYFCGCFCKPEVLLGNVFRDSIGKMFNQLIYKKKIRKLISRYKIIKTICKDCEFLPICNGGCPSFAYQEGDMFSKSNFFCSLNKILFPYFKNALRLGKRDLEKQR